MQQIRLYTTLGCHLCEQAQNMFLYLADKDVEINKNYSLELVEISDSNQLIEDYGVRIPVLKKNGQELAWPFSLEELINWLK